MKLPRALWASFLVVLAATIFLLSGPADAPDDAVISANSVLDLHAPWSSMNPEAREKRWTLNDPCMQLEPWREFMRSEVLAGRLPLWNHLNGFGEPFLANPQTRSFYPPQWLFLLGDDASSMVWYFHAFHVLLGGFGLVVLARRLGAGLLGATLAGLSFATLGFNPLWLLWPHHSTLAWLPLFLVAIDRCLFDPDRRKIVVTALVLALMFLAGHPETVFKSVVAAALFVAGRLLDARADGARDLRPARGLLGIALALVMGFFLAAIQLWPFLDYLFDSEALLARQASVAFPPHEDTAAFARGTAAFLAHLLSPDILGDGLDIDRWWFTEGNHNEVAAAYCGLLALLFAGFGLIGNPRARWTLVLLWLVPLAIVLRVPGFYQLLITLPGFDVGANSRFLAVVGMAFCLLAGFGFDRLWRAERRPFTPQSGLLLVAFLIVPAVALVIVFLAFPPDADQKRLQQALLLRDGTLLFIGLALLVLLYLRPRLRSMVLVLLAALFVYDIQVHARHRIPWTSKAELWPTTPVLEHLMTEADPAVGRVLAIESGFGAGSTREDERRRTLPAETNMHYGLASMESYNALQAREESRFTAAANFPVTANGKLSLAWSSPALFDDRLLDLAAVRWLLVPGDWSAQAAIPQGTEIRSVNGRVHIQRYAGPDGLVLERPTALPRAFLVWRCRGGDWQDVLDPAVDLANEAITSGPVPALEAGSGQVEMRSLRADRMDLEVVIESGRALLVTSDALADFWSVTVDGEEREIIKVDGGFRAVVVHPGRHEVVFRARAIAGSQGSGLVLTGLTALLAIVLASGVRLRRSTS